jgi:hypothetical protein
MNSEPTPIFTSEQISSCIGAAHFALICEIIGMLIETGVLNQDYVVRRLENLSKSLLEKKFPGSQYAIPVVDMARDHAAGKDRQPS